MLSRVAAVKAPRTHNRRRMTGSSGRRREGRESEPQRPNMSRHPFYSALMLLVVMMCCNTVEAQQTSEENSPAPIPPPKTYFDWGDVKDDKETVISLRVPSLVGMNGDVFAVAEAQCKGKNGNEEDFTGIASELLKLSDEQKKVELDKTKLRTQVLLECTADKEKCASQNAALEGASAGPKKKVHVSQPTTVVKENEIYMLVGKCSQTAVGPLKNDAEDCRLLLAKGNVSGESSNKRIYWNGIDDLQSTYNIQQEALTALLGGGGSGVHTEDGTLVFPVEGTKKGESNDGKTVSLLIYNSKDTTEIWKLSKEIPDGGCSDPSVVEWRKKDKKLMMMTACGDGRRRVYESADKGESWTEALGTLSRVWGNKQGEGVKAVRSGFITAKIGGDENNRNVMLVTLPVYPEKDGKKEKGELHLWLTDNTHIVDIGPVSDDDAAASSLLYRSAGSGTDKEELIALYEKKNGEESSPGMVSVLLTEQLKRVKDVLATWKKVDETVSKLCPSSAVENPSPGNACSTTVKITDGLVGFLSGNFSDDTWRDEYLGVNATVKNNEGGNKAALHEGSVKFTGAWAEWPVGSQGQNQLYHFANYNFTLVATVSIHGVPQEGPIPLMGVQMNDSGKTVLLGLSYNKERKWQVLCGDGTSTELSSGWEKETQYQVVLMLRNGTQGSVYVDGHRVGGDVSCALGNKDSKEISHFYIGGDGENADNKEGVSVTVTNVLLYNRPLDDTEIAALNPNKASTPPAVNEPSQGTVIKTSPGGQGKEGQRQLLGSSDVNGVSASTVSSATTSSGDEGPATPLASEESFDGTQNVGGDSFSDGDATVETVGGTNGQGEDIHARDKEAKAAALNSSLGNVSQGNNSDAGTVSGSGLLPLLLLLLLGLWGFAAL
ncbi:putative trans-sialidase, Group V [Trypanosoma cruzi]|uniref:Trans-sialidase, putative n=2 Tax=Trypanosoma cruzi TaxID=5693 RepID=Q4DY89_TRYCC|nr:trans-sialidase, putative [Trypanosoma cruzi]EAN97490.1 trans-sialidase, putative [Trypanosoma cruzi]PWV20683.1 putative trans-sialidase, Group V [Trypanosoma cruzi]|eukprot:XP_819341.1 trans-sialidase [Trypanosoma cruzi strain CL Brener]